MSTKLVAGTATSGAVLSSDTSSILELQTGSTPTTAITIDASQNVGIGTSSPNQSGSGKALTVNASSGAAALELSALNSNKWYINTDGAAVYDVTIGSQPRVTYVNGAERMRIDSSGNVQGASTTGMFKLANSARSALLPTYAFVNAADVGMYNPADSTLGFVTAQVERMRIDSSGNLLVGTTSAIGKLGVSGTGAIATFTQTASGNYVITSNPFSNAGTYYHCAFNIGGTGVGSITSTGSSTSYLTSSDYRLKENIAPMQGALDVVAQLKPVTYNWKADGSEGQGFIAHELQEVMPECVQGEKDAVDAEGKPVYQGIDTSFLVATLTAAIQEQQTMIEELNAKVTALETQLGAK